MKHPEPDFVLQYRATLKEEPPRVCHLCDHYRDDGRCAEFNEVPPEAFAREPGACPLWVEEVPF